MSITQLMQKEHDTEIKKAFLGRMYGMQPKPEIQTVEYLGNVWGCPKVVS